MNTVEKEKPDATIQDNSEIKSNTELDKLNEQIADLTSKNIELIVFI